MTDGPNTPEPPTPVGTTSTWSIDWRGAAMVAALVVIALVAWRWIDGGSNGSESDAVAEVTSPPSVAATTTDAPTTTTRPSTTTTRPPTTTTTIAPGPLVDIVGELKPCRFGDNCLVASFTITGFDDQPDRYECIYPNSRSEFGFNDDGEDDACFSGDAGDTIAIEVAGVVSNTVSADNLDGG